MGSEQQKLGTISTIGAGRFWPLNEPSEVTSMRACHDACRIVEDVEKQKSLGLTKK